MSIETAEKFKRDLTDKFVVVADNVSELRRFAGLTGKVKTVNMSCRALVEFDGPVDIGWYDIDPSYLKVIDAPLPKQSKKEAGPAAKTAEKKSAEKVAAKKPSGKKSPLQLAREQDAARAAAAATTQEKPKKKLSPLEMARMQDVAGKKEVAAEAKTEQKPAGKPKPAGKKLSPLEMARMQDAEGKIEADTDGDDAGEESVSATATEAEPEVKKKTPATGSGGKKLSPLEMARMQDSKK